MDAPAGKKYEGPSGVGRDSIWLTAEDLIEGKDAMAKIESVILYPEVTFQGGRKRVNMLGLKFVGKQRVLGLNATNRKVLNRMFGNIVKTWVGQEIVLYVAETQLAGETVKCVRIRDRGSRAASAAEEFLAGDEEPEAASGEPPKARSALLTAGWTEQQIATVNEACIALAITDAAKAALVTKHAGNYEAVYRDLNARADGGTQEVQ